MFKTQTRDFIQDVSKLNIPEWIEKTYRQYETSRYGGFDLQLRKASSTNVAEFIDLLDKFTAGTVTKINSSNESDDFFSNTEEDSSATAGLIPAYRVSH
jgi:hypothetical protein